MRRVLICVLVSSFVGCGGRSGNEGQESGPADEKPSAHQALQKELRYAPKDTTVVVSLQVENLLSSKFFEGLGAKEKKEIVEDIGSGLGIPLASVSRATLLANAEGSLWVLRTRTDLDSDQVLAQRLAGEWGRAAKPTFSTVTLNSATSPRGTTPVKKDPDGWKSGMVQK
jgi:hypothetical protein